MMKKRKSLNHTYEYMKILSAEQMTDKRQLVKMALCERRHEHFLLCSIIYYSNYLMHLIVSHWKYRKFINCNCICICICNQHSSMYSSMHR
jgi:hypothetical protein